MEFEKYINSTIEDFASDCIAGGFIEDLDHEQIKAIKEKFEEHKICFQHKSDFDSENSDIMESVIYGDLSDYGNVAIVCNKCNSVIIDSVAIKGDEE